nr:Fic family protein [uncultured Dongia sp.]
MPSQIIELSDSILHGLVGRKDLYLRGNFAKAGYSIAFEDDPERPLTVRVSVKPGKFGAYSLFRRDVLVAVLKPKGGAPIAYEPLRLPDGDVLVMLDQIDAVLDGLPDLSGHTRLALKRATNVARQATRDRPVVRRQHASAFELGLLRTARRFERRHRDALCRLGHQVDAYRTALSEPWLEPAIARLSVQAAFGDVLLVERRLQDMPRAGLLFLRERGDIFEAHRDNEQTLIALEEGVKVVGLHGDMPPIALDRKMVLRLHRMVAPDVYRLPGTLWRQRNWMFAHEGNRWSAPMAPAHAIEALLIRYGKAVDRDLWAGVHPLIRAGLLHLELLKIMPMPDTNFLVARLLLSLMLHEAGMPFLPLPALLFWDRERYLRTAQAAIRKDDAGIFLRYLVDLAGKASRRGIYMADRLRPAYDHMHRELLIPGETEGGSAALTEMALSRLFISDTSEVSSHYAAFARIDELAKPDLCDEIILAGGRSYSHVLVRELTRRPRDMRG